ncbi:MAG: transposase family protein, partial [Gomphosphaeria aponina SAG 52.96 = DSM 107014]|nr:transposase family protein [Gomphosphaeria aponina SAG 52.96 = DSM 107014]
NKKKKSGRPNNLTIEEKILLTLEYFREYRTYFHLGLDYNLHQSNVYLTIKKIEKILINSQEFKLPGKKILTESS